MNSVCVLVAGMPASGKSRMARELSVRLGLPMLSKDDIKELLYDTLGFCSREEKVALGVGAMEAMYYAARQVLGQGSSVILENNFEDASLPGLRALLAGCHARPVTVMLTGEPEAVYQRFVARDQSPERHRGHVVNTCYPEPKGEGTVCPPITLEQFVSGFTARGMARFDIGGPRVTVDVTELAKINYDAVAEQVRRHL